MSPNERDWSPIVYGRDLLLTDSQTAAYWEGKRDAHHEDATDLRALASHPSPPLPGQPGVAETVAAVLAEHGYRGYYGCRCEAVDGLGLPTGAAGKWHRAHVAAEVARALDGAS